MGPINYSSGEQEVFLGKSMQNGRDISDHTTQSIDAEVRRVIQENYDRAKKILTDNMDKLHMMAEALVKFETLIQNRSSQSWQVRCLRKHQLQKPINQHA